MTTFFLSHSDDKNWWVVEPRDDPLPQVTCLLRSARRVLCVDSDAVDVFEVASYAFQGVEPPT